MVIADDVLEDWHGIVEDDLPLTIRKTFDVPDTDEYKYAAGTYHVSIAQVEEYISNGHFKWVYWSPEKEKIPIPDVDISAYTSIFASTTDTIKTLKSYGANAKSKSPRALVAGYLTSRRLDTTNIKVPKLKKDHTNPYYDVWSWTCQYTRFLGPLPDHGYANPKNASHSHPMLPVLYHHFGCVCPSFEALSIIQQLVTFTGRKGVLEMASGNGYWAYMLRRMQVDTVAVDNLEAKWRTIWIEDTVQMNGVDYMKRNNGVSDRILLMVYMVTKGDFTKQVLKSFKGNTIVIAGTQNANRYTSFSEQTVEEYFEKEMNDWRMVLRIALPSFAGKDEGLFVYQK